MIRAVLFDLWGTLILDDPETSEARRVLRIENARAALAGAGFDYAAVDIEAAFLAADVEHEALHDDERDFSSRGRTAACMRHIEADLCDRFDDGIWRELDAAILTTALKHRPAMMPGAMETLAALRSLGLRCALISNAGITPGFVLRQLLDDLGLLSYLDPTLFSDEVEMCKPATAMFEHALAELGVTPEQAVFVGDQPRLDVFGSRRAGLWSVQIGDLTADGIEPHARIGRLDALIPTLRKLELLT